MLVFHIHTVHFSFFTTGGKFLTQPDVSNEGSFCIFLFDQTDSWLYPFEDYKAWHLIRNSFYFIIVFPSKTGYSNWKKTFTSEVSAGKDITSELTAFLYKSRKTEMDASIVSSTSW